VRDNWDDTLTAFNKFQVYHYTTSHKNGGAGCAHIRSQQGSSLSRVPRRQDCSPRRVQRLTQGYAEEVTPHQKGEGT